MSFCIRFVFLLLLFAGAASAQERFGLDHVGEIVRLSDPQISPDGRSVAIIVSRADFEENRRDIELVLVDVATGEQRVMTRRSVAQPNWSPSSSSLAFLSPVEGRRQLFVLPVDGGEATQITDAPTGVRSYSWRPDGGAFAYVSEEEPEMREGAERHNRSFEADVNYLLTEAPRSRHLWLALAGGGEAERLTSGEWSVGSALADGRSIAPSWSPDGRSKRGLNPDRKSSNYLQGCTICVSCRCTGPCWTEPPQREKRLQSAGAPSVAQ